MAAFTENEMKDFKITDWYDLSGQVAVVTGGSTGLGLAITKSVIFMHHGSIQVESKEDIGTTFTVKIPLIYIPSTGKEKP